MPAPSSRASTRASEPSQARLEDAGPASVWLILALVIEQPSHGYEISQRYKERFGSLLPTSIPRVYGALDRLRDLGMIEPIRLRAAKPEPRRQRMRRSYRATEAGVVTYRRWVAERMTEDPQRLELLGRIASAGVLGIDAVLDVIDHYQRQCIEKMRKLPRIRVRGARSSLEELTEALVIDQQRRELAARNDWAVHARKALEAHKQHASGTDSSREGEAVEESS